MANLKSRLEKLERITEKANKKIKFPPVDFFYTKTKEQTDAWMIENNKAIKNIPEIFPLDFFYKKK